MALERYRQKRNFRVTPEPAGETRRTPSSALSFVVQKHAATRLHYDFRLELDGVLLSWAVPKGPSLDPNDKRLAMQTEDHPLEYGDFEGVIPKGEYGGGAVMVWDRGTWSPAGDPRQAYAKGRLKFELHGEKLRGGWNLVRSSGGKHGAGSWLLFKEADDFARLGAQATITQDRANSVLSGRSLDEIAAHPDRLWHSNRGGGAAGGESAVDPAATLSTLAGAREAPMPELVEPQLASAVTTPPSGDAWIHEIKHDGYRMLCSIDEGTARFVSRTAKDWTATFPTLARAMTRLPLGRVWLDGEVVVLDDKGRSSFQALQNALSGAQAPTLSYVAFDILYLDGVDLRGVALIERKRVLERLLAGAAALPIRYSDHFTVPGPAFLANVAALGLEGMVSKRADRPYQSGRSTAWQKAKCKRRQEMVVGGFTDPEGSRGGFGALLLGVYEPDGTLSYAGKVGSGFTSASLDALHAKLVAIEQAKPAFRNPPRGAEARRAHWVDPVLVADVAFTEWTNDATLRHAVFHGLHDDRPAREVMREHAVDLLEPRSPPVPKTSARAATRRGRNARDPVEGVRLTHPDKLLYPDAKLSKRDLVDYYRTVSTLMLPHLRDRPLSLVRCPNGWDKTCFYQKNADDSADASLDRVSIPDGGVYMMAGSPSALAALVQMGVLEIHPWGSRSPRLGQPDRIVLDLDPEETLPWEELKRAVLVVKALIDNLGLVPFLRTTGGKGVHVVVPIVPSRGWEEIKGFTKAIAELLERTFPDRFTSKLLKVSRRNRVFIDYLRNAEGATAIASYSLRARAGAPVATPLAWDELDGDVRYAHFNAVTVAKRMRTLKHDPWADVERSAVDLSPALMARVGYKAR